MHGLNGKRVIVTGGGSGIGRAVCQRFGEVLGKTPRLVGKEGSEALLNHGAEAYGELGTPAVSSDQMLRWTADWVGRRGPLHNKPTHFGVRDGKF